MASSMICSYWLLLATTSLYPSIFSGKKVPKLMMVSSTFRTSLTSTASSSELTASSTSPNTLSLASLSLLFLSSRSVSFSLWQPMSDAHGTYLNLAIRSSRCRLGAGACGLGVCACSTSSYSVSATPSFTISASSSSSAPLPGLRCIISLSKALRLADRESLASVDSSLLISL